MIPGLEYAKLSPEVGQPTWIEIIKVESVPPQLNLTRDLVDPAAYTALVPMARALNCPPEQYALYSRNWASGRLSQIPWTTQLGTGLSLVFVRGAIYGGLIRLERLLNDHAQTLPCRMSWPA